MSILGAFDSIPGGMPTGAGRLIPVLLEQMKAYPGGIGGFLSSLREKGLGDIVASWLGNGANQAVTSEQLQHAIDPGMLQELANQSGQRVDGVLHSLTSVLPLIVDKLSPDGMLRDEEVDLNELNGMLSKVMGRFL